MNAHLIPLRLQMGLIAGGLALVIPLSANAVDTVPETVVQVKVLPAYYSLNKQRLGDVVALEALLGPAYDRVVRLDNCGPGTTQALLAAVAALHGVRTAVIEIYTLPESDPECSRTRKDLIDEGGAGGSVEGSASMGTDVLGRIFMP